MRLIYVAIVAVLFFLLASFTFAQGTPEQPDFPAVLLTVLGFLAPLLWQFVTKYVKNEAWKYIIANIFAVLTGGIALFLAKVPLKFDVTFILAFQWLASTAYKLIWKPFLFPSLGLKGKVTTY